MKRGCSLRKFGGGNLSKIVSDLTSTTRTMSSLCSLQDHAVDRGRVGGGLQILVSGLEGVGVSTRRREKAEGNA